VSQSARQPSTAGRPPGTPDEARPITLEVLPRATLCRCGASNHKPFCDNEHLHNGFQAPGKQLKINLSPVRPRLDAPITKAEDPRGETA